MLLPIPHSITPVVAQQDTPKPRPEVAPVSPPEANPGNAGVSLRRRPSEEILEEEYQRRRKRRQPPETPQEAAALEELAEAEQLDALQDAPRKGLWVDIEV